MEDVLSFARRMESKGFKSTKPTIMPSNSTNVLVLSRLGLTCFAPAKVLTES